MRFLGGINVTSFQAGVIPQRLQGPVKVLVGALTEFQGQFIKTAEPGFVFGKKFLHDDGLLQQCPVCKAPGSRNSEIGRMLAKGVLELSRMNVHRFRYSVDYFLTPSAHTLWAAANALPGSIGWPISFSTSSSADRAATMSN